MTKTQMTDSATGLYANLSIESQAATSLALAAENAAVDILQRAGIARRLQQLSRLTGGYVQLRPELSYMPALIGNDHNPVFLYHLVEGIDEFLDYDAVLGAYPTLSFPQVESALSFLRKLSQFNIRDMDIDEMEDEYDLNDASFMAALEGAFNDQEVVRVLSQPE